MAAPVLFEFPKLKRLSEEELRAVRSRCAAYVLLVELDEFPEPEFGFMVYRRIRVPCDLTLAELHLAVAAAMGWTEFEHAGYRFDCAGALYSDSAALVGAKKPDTALLSDVLQEVGDEIRYTYHLVGDEWVHLIQLQRIVLDPADAATAPTQASGASPADDLKAAVLLDGLGRCPPEDCGGMESYVVCLDQIEKKRKGLPTEWDHEEEEWWTDWLGCALGSFDPKRYDEEACRARLARFRGAVDDASAAVSSRAPPVGLRSEALWSTSGSG